MAFTLSPEEVADLKAQRSALVNARNTGARQVSHGDKTVSYRSLADINAAIASIDDQLAAAGEAVPRRVRQVRFVYSRGL